MQVTRRQVINDVLTFMGELGDDDARTLVTNMLPRVLERIWLKHPWNALHLPAPIVVTTIPGQRQYVLPDFFGRVGRGKILNVTTGSYLVPVDLSFLNEINPMAGTAAETRGTPEYLAASGVTGVSVQPTSPSTLEVLSSSGDDSDVSVTVEGFDANGGYLRSTVTLAGATAVPLVGTFATVMTFSKGFTALQGDTADGTTSRGTVTLRVSPGSTTLEALSADKAAADHPLCVLNPTPDGVYSIAIPTIRALALPESDSSYLPAHWGPMVFEELLIQVNVFNDKLSDDTQAPRPAFLEAVAFDNVGGLYRGQTRKRGFTV